MKIFFNTYPAAFQCPGGGEIQLLKSKEALERRGHDVILYDQWRHKLIDADVVHQFSVQGGSYNLSAYAHNNGIPLVLSPILWLSEYVDQYPMGEIGYAIQIADVICPNSQEEVDRFVRHFDAPESKYFVTHNGVGEKFFEQVSPELFLTEFSINKPFVLSVGNIERRKNQLSLIAANARIGLHTILIGNIRDQDYYAQIKSQFEDHFSYLGYLEHDAPVLRSAYAACSIFALPSLLETPGLAALEAAAAGATLVITNEGCTKEYFGVDALYVNPKDESDIAEKIFTAHSSNKKSDALRKRVREFTWDRVGEQLENAYHKALTTKQSSK